MVDCTPAGMTGTRTATTAAVLTATLSLAAAAWVISVQQMQGMDMDVETDLGSFQFFVAVWVSMMVAMMLPGALPALVRRASAGNSGCPPVSTSLTAETAEPTGVPARAWTQPEGGITAERGASTPHAIQAANGLHILRMPRQGPRDQGA
jgi:hypothetical protein